MRLNSRVCIADCLLCLSVIVMIYVFMSRCISAPPAHTHTPTHPPHTQTPDCLAGEDDSESDDDIITQNITAIWAAEASAAREATRRKEGSKKKNR